MTKKPSDDRRPSPEDKGHAPSKMTKKPSDDRRPTPEDKGHAPSKMTKKPSGDKEPTPKFEEPKNDRGHAPSKTSKKPSENKKSPTKDPKKGGSKCSGIEDAVKVPIPYQFEITVEKKKVRNDEKIMDLLEAIEDKVANSVAADLVDCSHGRSLTEAAGTRNVSVKRRLQSVLNIESYGETKVVGE